MSTGVPILPTQSVKIAWHIRTPDRPQTWIYKIGRFIISNAGTAGGAADWNVNDILISGVSQFVQSGDVAGTVFTPIASHALAPNEIDKFVQFKPVQITMVAIVVIVVMVTYIGLNEGGCPFFSTMVGTVVDMAHAEI